MMKTLILLTLLISGPSFAEDFLGGFCPTPEPIYSDKTFDQIEDHLKILESLDHRLPAAENILKALLGKRIPYMKYLQEKETE